MEAIERNEITEGVIWKQLLKFFFPIMLGTLFQTLYNTADAIIVSNVLGKEALAAVGGGTGTAINLILGFFVGISSGATVIISQHFGAKDSEAVHKAVHNACALALWGGILVSVVGVIATEPLLRLIGTPEDIMDLAVTYMRIYFAGTVIVVMYNIGSGIFRAFGDSKHPFYFLIVGCLVNIILDILMVGILGLGVAGAAYATVLSQLLALVLVIVLLRKRTDSCRLVYRDVRFNLPMLKRTLAIGLPAGVQSTLYTITNLLIVAGVNSFGTDTVAAWSAYTKIDSLYWMISGALGIAITTFVGQNFGAGLIERSRKGVRSCLAIGFILTILVEVFLMALKRPAYLLFVDDANVIEIGVTMMNLVVPYYFTFLFIEILSGAARGAGKSLIPTTLTAIGIVGVRVIWVPIAMRVHHTISAILIIYPISWVITSIAFILYYRFGNIYGAKEGRA